MAPRRRRSRQSHPPFVPHLTPPLLLLLLLPLLLLLALFLFVTIYYLRPRDSSVCDTDAAAAHPDLCGTSTRVCSDDAATTHAPRPLVVVAAGPSRAASTWLYNALRILMRIRDPNTVAGWHDDLHALYRTYARPMPRLLSTNPDPQAVQEAVDGASRAEAFRSLGSVLVKVHLVQEWHEFVGGGEADPRMEGVVDAVFTTHRDVREVVRSVRDMGWGVRASAEQMAHPEFCMRRRLKEQPTFLKSHHYANASTWVNLAQVHLVCRAALVRTAGDKLKMDVRAEGLRGMGHEATVGVLREMGRHLEYGYSEEELHMAARELRALRTPSCDAGFGVEMDVNPVTHLHKGHVHFEKSSMAETTDRRGMRAIAEDAFCARWLREHKYM